MDLFLSAHNDDETLFGAFTIIRHKPLVIVCFKSQVQEDRGGPTARVREMETEGALWWLGGATWQQLQTRDTDLNMAAKLADDLATLDLLYEPKCVWAPQWEVQGHEQHNIVAEVASSIFAGRVRPYLTYKRGSNGDSNGGPLRTRGTEVPFEPSWVVKKMRALCCYQSQIELDATRPWFMDDTLREYVP